MSLHRGYEPARTCTGGPAPGAKALMAVYLGLYADDGGTNLGIYNCRSVRGSSTTSLHGEGRACDLGVDPDGADWASDLAEQLRRHSGELGVQCVIWNRHIWSGAYPDDGWRIYTGRNAHRDHLHVELCRGAAAHLTAEQVWAVLAGQPTATKKDIVIDNIRVSGEGDMRLVCPTGRASAITGRAFLSAACDGPEPAWVRGWFQNDVGGISSFEWTLDFADGHSERPWIELPDGTTQINLHFDFPDGGVLCLEAAPK